MSSPPNRIIIIDNLIVGYKEPFNWQASYYYAGSGKGFPVKVIQEVLFLDDYPIINNTGFSALKLTTIKSLTSYIAISRRAVVSREAKN